MASIASGVYAENERRAERPWFPSNQDLTTNNKPQSSSKHGIPSFKLPSATQCDGNARFFQIPGVNSGIVAKPMLKDRLFGKASGEIRMKSMAAGAPEGRTLEMRRSQDESRALQAGYVDDNIDFSGFTAFIQGKKNTIQQYRERDTTTRHGLDIVDANGVPVQGAIVYMQTNRKWERVAVSNVYGQAWVFPKAISDDTLPTTLRVQYNLYDDSISLPSDKKARTLVQLNQVVDATIPRLDLSIVIDTTGSMADEIRKLQKTLVAVVREIEKQGVDVCLNVTAYRDVEDNYVVKGIDFTSNLSQIQSFVNDLKADGGGDEPEALNQALEHTIRNLAWRKQDNVVRSIMLITDAPPKMDTKPWFYDQSMVVAAAKGIRIHSVGTSGLNTDGGELVLRQLSQYTGGKFVFLTYANALDPEEGAGENTVHAVTNYSVETLDQLLLRLVKDDLGVEPQRGKYNR